MKSLNAIISAQPNAREKRFIFLTARSQTPEPVRSEASALIDAGLDWPFVVRYASSHGVAGLVYKHLRTVPDSEGAEEGLKQIEPLVRHVSIHSLRHMDEMFRIAEYMEARDIPIIPFKGPVLALAIYGDVSSRPFTDIDFLVERKNFRKAKEALKEIGYRPPVEMSAADENVHEESQMGYPMMRQDSHLHAELHWALINRIHSFRLSPEDLWRRHRQIEIRGVRIRTFAHEDLILYLCAHHTKHMWSRISWITDVAECLRHTALFDWGVLLRRAAELRCNRMLNLGLLLARELMDAELPENIRTRVYADAGAHRLAGKTVGELLFADTGSEQVDMDDIFWYQFISREAFRDRIPYTWHHLKMVVEPTEADRDFVAIPEAISFLYYIVRPFRLLAGLAGRPFVREARQGS